MSDTEAARSQASHDYNRNPQTPMKTEQEIQNATLRNEYNARLDQERKGS